MQTSQAEKYTYAVLGTGRQGTAAAYDMAKFGQASKVTIGDVDLKQARRAANHVNRLIGRKIAEGTRVDVRRPTQIKLAHKPAIASHDSFLVRKMALTRRVDRLSSAKRSNESGLRPHFAVLHR